MKIFARQYIKYWILAILVIAGTGFALYRYQVHKKIMKKQNRKKPLMQNPTALTK